jgi:acetate---CoA ligase (ADP-forming)
MAGVRVTKGVALVSQSSNIVINLTMQQRGLPVAYVACLGNAAVVGLGRTDRGACWMIRASRRRAVHRGDRRCPGLCRAGRERRGRWARAWWRSSRARPSFRGRRRPRIPRRLAGGGAASSAFLRQIGVAEVNTPSELIETLKIFHVHGPQIGARGSVRCPVPAARRGWWPTLPRPYGIDFPPVPQAHA